MASITVPVSSRTACGRLRPLNAVRDLAAVADLVELCFYGGADEEGRRYLQRLLRASRKKRFLRWAPRALGAMTLPRIGYVWEEDGRIVGNVSLVPFRHRGERIYLIANVAVHPDYRRRGIARALTQRALQHARERRAAAIWLHVRAENSAAFRLYQGLGFVPRAERTTWRARTDPGIEPVWGTLRFYRNANHLWGQQRRWLERAYPEELAWYYRFPDWNALRPGLWGVFYRLFAGYHVYRWVAIRNGQPLGVLAWASPALGERVDTIWVALAPGSDPSVLTALLRYSRLRLAYRYALSLDYPRGDSDPAIREAGFVPQRTLIWMKAEGSGRG